MAPMNYSARFMVITPINKNKRSKSNIDYHEQLERVKTGGYIWCWDDSVHNTAVVGDYFGFLFYNNSVHVHVITAIKSPSDRLPSWSANVGHSDRRVLELSDPVLSIDWETWIRVGGCKRCMGTYRTTDLLEHHETLYQYLDQSVLVF